MAFDEVRLPAEIEFGATGGARFNTTVFESKSGYEQRVVAWAQRKGEWRVGYGLTDDDDRTALVAFFHARQGRARGFRFKDWSDYKHDMASAPAAAAMVPAVGDGAEDTFQLVKVYSDGVATYSRNIVKPLGDASELIYLDGTPTALYTLDPTTGVVVFDSPPGVAVVPTWEGEFDVPVRLDEDLLQVELEFHQLSAWRGIRIVETRDF